MQLADAVRAGYRIIDIRGEDEIEVAPLPVPDFEARALPWLLEQGPRSLDPGRRYLVVCARGLRSLAAVERLRAVGLDNIYALAGGAAGQPLATTRYASSPCSLHEFEPEGDSPPVGTVP